MEQKPPRRARRRSGGDVSFPIIPAVLAVLVIGFLIGAALSLFGNRIGSPVALTSPPPFPSSAPVVSALPVTPRPERAAVLPAATPTAQRTAKPNPSASPAPAAPTPPATPARALTPAAVATRLPAASPRPAATASPQAATTASPEPAATPATPARAAVRETSKPLVILKETPRPVLTPSEAAAASTGASSDYADSDFAQLSAGVVRAYLGALARGDESSAYAAFGASPGDRGIIFIEQGIIDSKTQIARVDARQTGTDAATVDVTLRTSKGQYFAQYFLKRSPTGAALITDHEMIKP